MKKFIGRQAVTARERTGPKTFRETLACGCRRDVRLISRHSPPGAAMVRLRHARNGWAMDDEAAAQVMLALDPMKDLQPKLRWCPTHQPIPKSQQQIAFYRDMRARLKERALLRGLAYP